MPVPSHRGRTDQTSTLQSSLHTAKTLASSPTWILPALDTPLECPEQEADHPTTLSLNSKTTMRMIPLTTLAPFLSLPLQRLNESHQRDVTLRASLPTSSEEKESPTSRARRTFDLIANRCLQWSSELVSQTLPWSWEHSNSLTNIHS